MDMSVTPEIQQDLHSLQTLWNIFAQEQLDSSVGHGPHPLPAMNLFSTVLINNGFLENPAIMERISFEDEDAFDDWVTTVVQSLCMFSDAMFRFAQYCYAHGVLHANMTPCTCSTVTDEDITDLLKDPERVVDMAKLRKQFQDRQKDA